MLTYAYIANEGSNLISVIDINTQTVIDIISIESTGSFPQNIAITPDGKFVYVTNLSNNVSVIDTITNTIVDTISVNDLPNGIAITPDSQLAYITNEGSDNVSVIDLNTNTVVQTIPVGIGPTAIAITPNGAFAYVANSRSDNISIIDTATHTIIDTIPVRNFPQGIAVTPNGSTVYVTNQGQSVTANTVSVIDVTTNTVVNNITVDTGPSGIAITPDGNFAYVTNGISATVSVIDINTNTVIQTIPVGRFSFGIAITPDGNFAYVTNAGSNNVSIIDTNTNTVINTISIGGGPLGAAISNVPEAKIDLAIAKIDVAHPIKIEAKRIFDSCSFEEEISKVFKIPCIIGSKHIACNIVSAKSKILDINEINKPHNLVNVKLRIKVVLKFITNLFDEHVYKKTVYLDKNITLTFPEEAEITCEIKDATCKCIQTNDVEYYSYQDIFINEVCCTIKINAVLKSKKLIEIDVPFLERDIGANL